MTGQNWSLALFQLARVPDELHYTFHGELRLPLFYFFLQKRRQLFLQTLFLIAAESRPRRQKMAAIEQDQQGEALGGAADCVNWRGS